MYIPQAPQQHPSEKTGRGAFISQQSGKRGNIIYILSPHSFSKSDFTTTAEQWA